MLPQFPFPAWLDGSGLAVGLMALIGWAGFAALVVVGAVLAARELGRRRRVALADAAARATARATAQARPPADGPLARPGQQRDH